MNCFLGLIDQFLFGHLTHTGLIIQESDNGTMFRYPCGIHYNLIVLDSHLAVVHGNLITPRVIDTCTEDMHVIVVFLSAAVRHQLETVDAVLDKPYLQLAADMC